MKPQGTTHHPSKILPCNCIGVTEIAAKSGASKIKAVCTNIPFNTKNNGADYQNKKYGHGNRLHNAMAKDGKLKGHACTICGMKKAA